MSEISLTASSAPVKSGTRIVAIDTAKLLCLFFILLGHVPPGDGDFLTFTHSVNVPLFFLVSGIFYKSGDARTVAVKGLKGLLKPYLIFNLIVIAIGAGMSLMSGFDIKANLLDPILGMVLGTSDTTAPATIPGNASWFLVALTLSRLLIIPLINGPIWARVLWGFVLAAVYTLLNMTCSWVVWSIDSAILGTGFMFIGYCARPYINDILTMNIYRRIGVIICLALLIPLSLYNGRVNIFDGAYGNNPAIFFLCGVSGALLIMLLCTMTRVWTRGMQLFISGSIFFICCHIMIMEYLLLAYRRVSGSVGVLTSPERIGLAIATVAVCYLCMLVMKRFAPSLLK